MTAARPPLEDGKRISAKSDDMWIGGGGVGTHQIRLRDRVALAHGSVAEHHERCAALHHLTGTDPRQRGNQNKSVSNLENTRRAENSHPTIWGNITQRRKASAQRRSGAQHGQHYLVQVGLPEDRTRAVSAYSSRALSSPQNMLETSTPPVLHALGDDPRRGRRKESPAVECADNARATKEPAARSDTPYPSIPSYAAAIT